MKFPVLGASALAAIGLTIPAVAGMASAGAHAEVIAQSPSDGKVFTYTTAKKTVSVDFGEVVEITTSSLRIRDAAGKVVSGKATLRLLPSSDPDVNPARVSATSVKTLPRGRYAVEYSVLSQDGHRVARALGFAVGVATSASKPSVVGMSTTLPSHPAPRVVISRLTVGKRTITVTMPSGTNGGEVKLTCQRVGTASPRVSAPFIWSLGSTVSGKAAASGYIPTPCNYRISVTVNRPFPQYPSTWLSTSAIKVGS